MLKGLPIRLIGGFFLLLAASLALPAQSVPCPTGPALLSPSDPAYADAMELKQILENHDFTVQCIFPTKLGSIFMVDVNGVLQSTVEGEACFRTNRGDIGVVFVPKPQTFADFKITERRKGGGYLYRFTGAPRVWAGDKFKFNTANRQYFLKQDNYLFIVSDSLLGPLEDTFHLSLPTL
jgi:hypothetical protein